jgi:hypothetical protein
VAGRLPRAIITGVPAGVLVAGLAIAAHASAGGEVSGIGPSIAVATCALGAVSLTTSIRWTFVRILVAATALQPVLHLVLGGHAGHDAHHAHGGAAASAAGAADPQMWIMHGGLAILTAVALRWGVRWVRSMPALARALLSRTPAWVGVLPIASPVEPATTVIACDRHSLLTWTNRGPPG